MSAIGSSSTTTGTSSVAIGHSASVTAGFEGHTSYIDGSAFRHAASVVKGLTTETPKFDLDEFRKKLFKHYTKTKPYFHSLRAVADDRDTIVHLTGFLDTPHLAELEYVKALPLDLRRYLGLWIMFIPCERKTCQSGQFAVNKGSVTGFVRVPHKECKQEEEFYFMCSLICGEFCRLDEECTLRGEEIKDLTRQHNRQAEIIAAKDHTIECLQHEVANRPRSDAAMYAEDIMRSRGQQIFRH